jgi:hypothetical protein
VIHVLGGPATVLAGVAVAEEHGLAARRDVDAARHADEVPEPDHAGGLEAQMLGAEDDPVPLQDFGFLTKNEDDSPPHRHDTERLEGRVEDERSSQASPPPTYRLEILLEQGLHPEGTNSRY